MFLFKLQTAHPPGHNTQKLLTRTNPGKQRVQVRVLETDTQVPQFWPHVELVGMAWQLLFCSKYPDAQEVHALGEPCAQVIHGELQTVQVLLTGFRKAPAKHCVQTLGDPAIQYMQVGLQGTQNPRLAVATELVAR